MGHISPIFARVFPPFFAVVSVLRRPEPGKRHQKTGRNKGVGRNPPSVFPVFRKADPGRILLLQEHAQLGYRPKDAAVALRVPWATDFPHDPRNSVERVHQQRY